MFVSSNLIIILTVVAYMVFMIGIGINLSKKNQSANDFYLGGRTLGPYVTAMSAEASDMSSYLLMGVPGVALAGLVGMNGSFAEAIWTIVGLSIGTYLNWLIVAKKLRLYSEKIHAATIPDFFANRFGDKSDALAAISAIVIIFFFVPYTASGFAGVGKMFNSLFGIDYHVTMILGAIVISLYTTLGGFLAASTTDFIQSIIMTIALFVVLVYGVHTGGGMDEILANAREAVPNYFSLTGTDGSYSLLPIISTMAWGLGYFGMPHILLRFMAIRDEQELKLSRRIATVWVVISMTVAVFIGVIGYSFLKETDQLGMDGLDPERILIYFSTAISKLGPLFAIIAGLIISGILASIMSTADSQMLAASSSVSENLVKRFIWKSMPEHHQMALARLTVIAIAVIGVFFAWNPDGSVFRIVSFAWAGFGSAFGPVMLFSLFWKRTTRQGATAGMIAGGVMDLVWKFGISRLGGLFTIYELLPAFCFSCLVIVIVSLLTPEPDKEITDTFDEVHEMMKHVER